MLSFFPRGVLDEILNLIESVSEGFPSYSYLSLSVETFSQRVIMGDMLSQAQLLNIILKCPEHIALSSNCSFFKLADIQDRHKVLDLFEYRPYCTIHLRVTVLEC